LVSKPRHSPVVRSQIGRTISVLFRTAAGELTLVETEA